MTFLVLVNGLWQSLLFAGIAALIARALPARDAATRYALWLTTLVAVTAIPIATTVMRVPVALPNFAGGSGAATHVGISLTALSTQAAHDGMPIAAIVPWLLVLWGVGVLFNVSRLLFGASKIARIARRARSSQHTANDVFLSDEIDVPLVAGIVAPRILIPADLLRTLDAADLHRIVAHERAHVHRNDPWWNLFARVIEAVLFFNPVVHFIVRKLAEEREAACDDVAISQSGRSLDYAACLAAIATMSARRVAAVSPTALGFRASLLPRIARLQSAHPRITTINRTAFGGIVMLFAIVALALQTITPMFAFAGPIVQSGQRSSNVIAAACARPNVDAVVLVPQPPEVPHRLNRSSSVQAVVTIAPSGRVGSVRILRSSGDSAIDAAVLSAARHSTYRAKVVDCVAVQGTYVFRADFKP